MLTLDLRPLRAAEARELARALTTASDAVLDGCVARADGNPLFLEQLLRNADSGEQDSLPGSIHSLVPSRLDRLQARDRRAIQAASALGQCFSLPLLRTCATTPAIPCSGEPGPAARRGSCSYTFSGKDYASLLTEQRTAWHRAARGGTRTAIGIERRALSAPRTRARRMLSLGGAREGATPYGAGRAIARARGGEERRGPHRCSPGGRWGIGGRTRSRSEQLLTLAGDDRLRAAQIGLAAGMRACDRRAEALTTLDEAQSLAAGPGFERSARRSITCGETCVPLGNARLPGGAHAGTERARPGRWSAAARLGQPGRRALAGSKLMSSCGISECVALGHQHRFVRSRPRTCRRAFCAF
jgi:hypothetical protein